MLEGITLRLRPWRDEDLPVLTNLRNDIDLQAQLLTQARGSRIENVREWLKARSNESNTMFFIIAERIHDETLGFLQVCDLDLLNGHANLGICFIAQARGNGMGGQAIALLSEYLKNYWKIRKLTLKVRADNTSALRCYEKAGFKHCGLLRSHFFNSGRWYDVVLMECFLKQVD